MIKSSWDAVGKVYSIPKHESKCERLSPFGMQFAKRTQFLESLISVTISIKGSVSKRFKPTTLFDNKELSQTEVDRAIINIIKNNVGEK